MQLSAMSFWERVLYLLGRYGASFARGAWVTMAIAVVSTAIGCLIGFGVGIVQTIPTDRKNRPVHWFLMGIVRAVLEAYVEVFRGTPMMVQAMFIYFGSMQLFNINMDMWTAAFFIVSINTGAYMAETVRGGILSIDSGQTEGAKAIGMNHLQTMIQVILPQAFRNIIPQIGNNFIINIKDTSVLSVISITDLFFVHKSVVGALYLYFQSATIVMAIYLTLTLTSSFLLRKLESKLDGNDSYDLATTDTLAHTSGLTKYRPQKRSRES
jgi:putative lysine transport system permease protein